MLGPVGPTQRRTREELRAVLLDVGVNMLLSRGLVGGAEHITFADVFVAAEPQWGSPVNPASVYKRIWQSQSEFQIDVLLTAAAFYPDGEEQPTLQAARRVLARHDLSTPRQREAALSEVCRIAGELHIRILEASRPWQIWVGIWALTVSTPTLSDDELVGPAIQAGHDKATAALVKVLEEVIPSVGYRIAAPYSFEQLALTIGALAEGLALRDRFARDLAKIERLRPSPDHASPADRGPGPSERWTLFGVAVEGLVHQFCEPDETFDKAGHGVKASSKKIAKAAEKTAEKTTGPRTSKRDASLGVQRGAAGQSTVG